MYELLSAYLENGLQVVLHKIPHSRTFSAGLWIKQGSKNETDENNGYSHLIEHLMISKENSGSDKLGKLFQEISNNGVIYNAGTTKESTSYYFSGLAMYLDKTLNILSKLMTEERNLSNEAFDKEKSVVIQEAISFYSSFNQIKERSSQALWGDTSVGRTIVGRIENLKSAKLLDLKQMIQDTYTPSNAVLVVVGDIEYEECMDKIGEYFAEWEDIETKKHIDLVESNAGIFFNKSGGSKNSVLSICFRAPSFLSEERLAISIISKIIGDSGLSSRMMKSIRAKYGLSYVTGSFHNAYEDYGTLGMTSVCSNDDVYKVAKIISHELIDIHENGFTKEEMNRCKNVLETQTLINLGNVEAQMKYIGKNAVYGHLFSLENELRSIQKLELDDINYSAKNIFTEEGLGFAGIGNFELEKAIDEMRIGGR